MAILETDDLILEPDKSTRFEISCSRSGASAAWSSDHLILSPSREEVLAEVLPEMAPPLMKLSTGIAGRIPEPGWSTD